MNNSPPDHPLGFRAHLRASLGIVLLIAGFLASGGMSSTCTSTVGSTNQCTPSSLDYDSVSGLCTSQNGGDFGPAIPGSGNLPSEPDTPTPTAPANPNLDPSFVDLSLFGLSGRWVDNGRMVCIQHTNTGIIATYYIPYSCDHGDGSGQIDQTFADFTADFSGNFLSGTTTVCVSGHADKTQNGLRSLPLVLTLSTNGKTLSGTWHNPDTNADMPITLSRRTVGDCSAP